MLCTSDEGWSLQYNARRVYSRNEGAPGTWMVIKVFAKTINLSNLVSRCPHHLTQSAMY